MTTTASKAKDGQDELLPAEELKGRLVLVTGATVKVPVEGLAVTTEHYDETAKATVPVASRYTVD